MRFMRMTLIYYLKHHVELHPSKFSFTILHEQTSKTDQNSWVNALRVSFDPDNMASGEN